MAGMWDIVRQRLSQSEGWELITPRKTSGFLLLRIRGGAGLASRAAAFQATEAAGAGGGGGGGGLMRRNRLATLVGEQQCASPLSSSAVGCLW